MVRPYLLAGPALLLFAAILVVPLAMTVLLSFNDFSTVKGIQPVYILKNWRDLFTDPYFREMFEARVTRHRLTRNSRRRRAPGSDELRSRLEEAGP